MGNKMDRFRSHFKTLAIRALSDIQRSAVPHVLYPIKHSDPARVLNIALLSQKKRVIAPPAPQSDVTRGRHNTRSMFSKYCKKERHTKQALILWVELLIYLAIGSCLSIETLKKYPECQICPLPEEQVINRSATQVGTFKACVSAHVVTHVRYAGPGR